MLCILGRHICWVPQAGRPIHMKSVSREAMQIAILNPLAMGSKGRFVLVQNIQVIPRL